MSIGGFEQYEMLYGDIPIQRASREPCPVCGHPTGDCTGKSEPPKKILLQGTTPSLQAEQSFYVEENIYEDRQINEFTNLRVLLVRAGTNIPYARARELGLI